MTFAEFTEFEKQYGCWDTKSLTIDTCPDVGAKTNFSLLLGAGLFSKVSSYQPRDNLIKKFTVTVADNVSAAKWTIPLVFGFLHDSLNSAKFI